MHYILIAEKKDVISCINYNNNAITIFASICANRARSKSKEVIGMLTLQQIILNNTSGASL